jgi:metal-responsive CopG/Arc/MetJ family transcriptional regulator
MAIKVTFTLDEATVGRLNDTARRLAKPKSEVVREAIRDYHFRSDRLGEAERRRMLRVLDQMMKRPPTRSQRDVGREIAQIRAARKSGGRLHAAAE